MTPELTHFADLLHDAAQGRQEYAKSALGTQCGEHLKGEVEMLSTISLLLNGSISETAFLRAMLPSWRWAEHGVGLD